jgi:hypothetical protein
VSFNHSARLIRLTVQDAGETSTDPYNPSAVNGTAPKPGNLFWSTGTEHELPHGLEVPEVPKQAMEEDMTPLDVDEGSLNA